MNRRIILLGPPASGKGTVAAHLEKELGLKHISSGHLLRQETEAQTAIGRSAGPFLSRGELAPDATVLELMRRCLGPQQAAAGFLLDGFPRNVKQANELDRWMEQQGTPIDAAILFEAGETAIFDRLTSRRTCPACGRVYNEKFLAPKKRDFCDDCGIVLVRRDDDRESVVAHRLETYRRETEQLGDYYRRQAKLRVVDAELSVSERTQRTLAFLEHDHSKN